MKHYVKSLVTTLCCCFLTTNCQDGTTADHIAAGVTYELATWRQANYTSVSYELFFSLPEQKTEAVNGSAGISVRLQQPEPLVLDFRENASKVRGVTLNGQPVTYRIANEHIVIDRSQTTAGLNKVDIDFVAGNQSLNRNDEFMYTLLVPDRARTLFPCFDQPGLKARFRLTLEVPESWKAVSNTFIEDEAVKGSRRTIRFGQTEPLSTYLFSFVAGKLEQQTYNDGKHTFAAYYRETDPQKLRQLETIFSQVAASLEWLEDYTGIDYPFAKYDLVILPGFQYGGMEHTGATLYNDNRMFLSEHPTLDEELGRTQLIAHETAHMWFGDLVTMAWFNDVWTKEVFANHFAARISEPLFKEVNHRLNRMKLFTASSLSEDRTLGTTSIQQRLDNLNQAGLVYGQIIYNKAPIMMEKLIDIMGEAGFQTGIRTYLQRYAYGNATWDQLIEILDSISPADLKQFSEAWVHQKGMPDITFQTRGTTLTVKQTDPYQRGICWPQRLEVTVLRDNRRQTLDIELDTDSATVGLAFEPDVVLPNTDGKGYGRFLPDRQSLDYMLQNWTTLDNETARYAVLMTLQENYLAQRLTDAEWNRSLTQGLPGETNPLIASTLTDYLAGTLRGLTDSQRRAAETFLYELSQRHPLPSCRQQLLRHLITQATSADVIDSLYALWEQQSHPLLNEKDYTTLAYELALRRPQQQETLLSLQRSRLRDPDRQRQFDFIARALTTDEAGQDRLFESLRQAENRRIEPWTASVLGYLNHPLREKHAVKYIRPGLELLEEVQRTGDIFFPRNWTGALLGNHRSQEAYKEVQRFLQEHPSYPPLLKNKILQASYGLFRATGNERP